MSRIFQEKFKDGSKNFFSENIRIKVTSKKINFNIFQIFSIFISLILSIIIYQN